jgi:hypothetical protein
MSNTATTWAQVDVTPPGAITTLSGEPGPVPESVKLSWLAPGDDEYTGTLPSGSQYKIQYSTASDGTGEGKSGWSYNNAQITISTNSVPVGTLVGYVITGLTGGVTYYIKIWTADEVPNWSDMSNTATTWAQVGVYIPSQYANILCYGEPTTSPYTLKYRVLEQGSTYWSTEMATNLVTQHKIRWVRVAKHPTKNERIAVFSGVDASNYVAIMVSTWSSTYGWSATTFTLVSGLPLSNNDKRCFDVVYE